MKVSGTEVNDFRFGTLPLSSMRRDPAVSIALMHNDRQGRSIRLFNFRTFSHEAVITGNRGDSTLLVLDFLVEVGLSSAHDTEPAP